MKLGEWLQSVVDQLQTMTPEEQDALLSKEMVIPVRRDGFLGGQLTTPVQSVFLGFDWNSDQIMFYPERELMETQLNPSLDHDEQGHY